MLVTRILLIFPALLRLSQGGWYCGGVVIDDDKKCKCGTEILTSINQFREDILHGQCCGPDTCSIDENGDGICVDGISCNTRWPFPWNCGNIMIAKEKVCQCGSVSLEYDQYTYHFLKDNEVWCCPLEPCSYQIDGTAICHNATIVQGKDKGCNGGVCFSRSYLPCKSGNQCVDKDDICHGAPQCDDGSDLATCGLDNKEDICPPSHDFSKCAADIPSYHQECYWSGHDKNNQQFDCITRGDETNEETSSEETIDYGSITACETSSGYTGLMCGTGCWDISWWCSPIHPMSSCTTNTTFSTHNPTLCQNRTFWEDKSCNLYHRYSGYNQILLTAAGQRCKGRLHHCYYPHYNASWLSSSCEDYTDKIFSESYIGNHSLHSLPLFTESENDYISFGDPPLNSANENDYMSFGDPPLYTANENDYISFGDPPLYTANENDYISFGDPPLYDENENDYISLGDPPPYTESKNVNISIDISSYFQCPIHKILHYIHPELICDGHAVCDNSEDEVLTHECITKLTKLKAIKPTATKVCTSKMYADKNMKTVAVVCDGVEECLYGVDEGWLCTNSNIPFYGTMFLCVMLLLLLILYKFYRGYFLEIVDDSELLVLPDILNEDVFKRNHDDRKFRDEINLFIQISKVMDCKSDRIAKNQKLYDIESKIHRGNVAEIRLCLKNNLDWSNAKIVIEDAFPGILRKRLEFIENILEMLDKQNFFYWIFHKVNSIFSIYLDIFKDSIFVITILFLIGGPTSLYYFPTKLTSVVVYCFLVTIIMPLVCSSIIQTQRELKNEKERPFRSKLFKYFYSILLSSLSPFFMAESYEENKAKRKSLIKFERNMELVIELNKEGQKLSKNYSEFVRVDLGLEVMFQLSGQIMYLLLSSTNTPTTGGLEEMFERTSDAVLALSIGLSIKTIFFVTLKTISIVKPFLPFTTKMVLLLWIIISSSIRVMSIVLFFTPSFGLFSILGHWKLEQIPYSEKLNDRFENMNTVYLYNSKPVKWTDLNRYNYTSDSGPHYDVYTYYSLKEYFYIFWILLFLQTYTNLLAKMAFSEDFRKSWTSFKLPKFFHCLENTNIATVWKDWEEKDGSIDDHKERHRHVIKEMVVIMIIKTVFHFVMFTPIVYTGNKKKLKSKV